MTEFVQNFFSTNQSLGNTLKSFLEIEFSRMGKDGMFKEYTEHGVKHSEEIIKIFDWLIHNDTSLNDLEKLLLMMSAYFHDIGMVPRDEIISTLKNNQFDSDPNFKITNFSDFLSDNNTVKGFAELDYDIKFEEYIRKIHPLLSANIILSIIFPKLCPTDCTSCHRTIARICASHGYSFEEVEKLSNAIPIHCSLYNDTLNVNVKFLSILLRLADLLDISNKRAPEYVYNIIKPKNYVSVKEWAKHLNTLGIMLNPQKTDEILVNGAVKDIDTYFLLLDSLKNIEHEIQKSWIIIRGDRYKISPNTINIDTIETIGFDKLPLKFNFDKEEVAKLFSSYLYTYFSYEKVVLRELLQNSIDAIRFRKNFDKHDFNPLIEITINKERNELTFTDNGKGMDLNEVQNSLLVVGKSFYSDFKQSNLNFFPYSRFGIGFLSYFLLSKKIEVVTKHFDGNKNVPIQLIIRSVSDYIVKVEPQNPIEIGTSIRLELKKPLEEDIIENIKYWALHLDFPIKIKFDDNEQILESSSFPFPVDKPEKSINQEFKNYDETSKKVGVFSLNYTLKEIEVHNEHVEGYIFYYYCKQNDSISSIVRLFSDTNEKINHVIQNVSLDGLRINRAKILGEHFNNTYTFLYDINIKNQNILMNLSRDGLAKEKDDLTSVSQILETFILESLNNLLVNTLKKDDKIKLSNSIIEIINIQSHTNDTLQQQLVDFIDALPLVKSVEFDSIQILKTKNRFEYVPRKGINSYPNIFSDNDFFSGGGYLVRLNNFINEKRNSELHDTIDFYNFDHIKSYLFRYFTLDSVMINFQNKYSGLIFKRIDITNQDIAKEDEILTLPFYQIKILDKRTLATVIGPYLVFNIHHPLIKFIHEKNIDKTEINKLFKHFSPSTGVCFFNNQIKELFFDNLNDFLKKYNCDLLDGFNSQQSEMFLEWDSSEYWKTVFDDIKIDDKQA